MVKPLLSANPVRKHRMALGLTIREMARDAGIQYNTLLQLEAGVYTDILPAILSFFERQGIITAPLNKEYKEFQRVLRRANFRNVDLSLPEPDATVQPMFVLREQTQLGFTEFYRRLAINAGISSRAETGKVATLPTQIKHALLDAGMPEDDVEELNYRIGEYHERFVAGRI